VANNLNRCEFIGRLGKDPETRYTAKGDAITNISIACSWKSKEKEGAEWIPIVFFGKLAEIADKYLKKGGKVYVAGKYRTRKWADKNGQDRWSTEIVGYEMEMLDSKPEGDSSQAPAPSKPAPAPTPQADEFSDDIPFRQHEYGAVI